MKNLLLMIPCLFILIGTGGCEDKEPEIVKAGDISLVGHWQWINTWRVYPASDTNPETPANTGIEELLVFNADATWYKTQNNVLVDSGSYSLGHGSYAPYQGAQIAVYDSICYYQNNIPVKNGIDYFEIDHDTLVFCAAFAYRWSSYTLSHSGTKRWVRQK